MKSEVNICGKEIESENENARSCELKRVNAALISFKTFYLLPSTARFMQCVASSIKQRAVNWFGSSDALLITAMISGGKFPMSSMLKPRPRPRPAMPLVRATSADVNDFDLCNGKGFNRALFKIPLLLLFMDA